jgi:PKHD-type hydroxylase
MFLRIPNLLSEDDLSALEALSAGGRFVDGAASAGTPTRAANNNLQLEPADDAARRSLIDTVTRAVTASTTVRASALPSRLTAPMLTKYEPGMSYGWHVDNAIMGGLGGQVRSDIACTIFLSEPKDYDGGELVVQTSTGEAHVRLERGEAFLYPATSRHRVTEVTRGERLAVVFWIQSLIAEASRRELLNDLNLAYESVLRENADSGGLQLIQRAHANLVRMWSDL